MIWMKHIGCNTPIVEYRGVTPLVAGMFMCPDEWFGNDGNPLQLKKAKCDDCGAPVKFSPGFLIDCDTVIN